MPRPVWERQAPRNRTDILWRMSPRLDSPRAFRSHGLSMASSEASDRSFSLHWKQEDRKRRDRLLARHLPWITERVRRRLGPALRAKVESQDLVQAAALKVLHYGPRVEVGDENAFRALLARIVENVIRDEHAWLHARRRAVSQERRLGGTTSLRLDPPRREVARPSEEAARHEEALWVALAVELCEASDRQVLELRQAQELSFAEIGDRLGVTESGARMRYARALTRVSGLVARLREGKLAEIVTADDDAGGLLA